MCLCNHLKLRIKKILIEEFIGDNDDERGTLISVENFKKIKFSWENFLKDLINVICETFRYLYT